MSQNYRHASHTSKRKVRQRQCLSYLAAKYFGEGILHDRDGRITHCLERDRSADDGQKIVGMPAKGIVDLQEELRAEHLSKGIGMGTMLNLRNDVARAAIGHFVGMEPRRRRLIIQLRGAAIAREVTCWSLF